MNILFLRGFNNYFNRTVKKYSSLDDYKSHADSYLDLTNINFNPNDGVATELIVGGPDQQENNLPLDWENIGTPDYAICYETATVSELPVNTIKSRWYVLESERTRNGQYRIALKRDVIAEYFDQIQYAPCFIEKGMISDDSNPLIFNRENMTYNQIKKNEYALKDETQIPWIVGYISQKSGEESGQFTSYAQTLDSSGQKTGTISMSSGLEVSKITLNLANDDVIWNSTAYDTSVSDYTFQATYNRVSGVLRYRINIGLNWANYTVYIKVYTETGTSISTTIVTPPEDYINSEDLPWTFNPSSPNLSTITDYTISKTIVNRIGFSSTPDKYRYIWVDIKKNVSSSGQSAAGTTVLVGSENTWNSSIATIYSNYTTPNGYNNGPWTTYGNESKLKAAAQACFSVATSNIITDVNSSYTGVLLGTDDIPSNISIYNNKIIKHGSKYYRITIGTQTTATYNISKYSGTSYNNYKTQSSNFASNYNTRVANDTLKLNMNYQDMSTTVEDLKYTVNAKYVPITAVEINLNVITSAYIPSDISRAHPSNSGYDIFAIPYGDLNIIKTGTSYDITVSKDTSMSVALEIAKQLGSKLYDIQLLPYCPVRYFISGEKQIDLALGTQNVDYSLILETNANAGTTTLKSAILWADSVSGTFDITKIYINSQAFNISTIFQIPEYYERAIDMKIDNETRLYRLVSPNYSGQFEFSVAKNGGLAKFNVDYTYKPYNPYIHINPGFGGLYGEDFDDSRGLILGGDFSLPIISDAWINYQINNKNYQEIFDRQIQNMDVNNQIAMEQQNWSKMTGALTGGLAGGAGGALAGAKVGGGWGALAGGVLGLGMGLPLSLIGGDKDEDWLRRQQWEARDYAIDMYGYQLGNIQALPYSLTKTSAITYNNKLFPIIEIYSCTDEERNILLQKLLREGMTIMAIGYIADYYDESLYELNFIKGKLIKLDGLNDDFHIADALYQEVEKGFYILGS